MPIRIGSEPGADVFPFCRVTFICYNIGFNELSLRTCFWYRRRGRLARIDTAGNRGVGRSFWVAETQQFIVRLRWIDNRRSYFLALGGF